MRNHPDKIYSAYNFDHLAGTGATSLYDNFEEALKKNPEILSSNLYSPLIKRYYDIFPRKNILVLLYEDIKNNEIKFIQDIYEFLEVDNNFIPESANKKIHVTGQRALKYPWLTRLVWKLYISTKKNFIVKRLARKPIKLWVIEKITHKKTVSQPKQKIPMNPKTRKYLLSIFAQDRTELSQLTGRNFSLWES